MDREILFHGKRLDNGEWVEGFVVTMPNTSTTKILVWCKSYIVDGEGRQEFNVYEVDPSTVGQYTGLTDKNGTKIFEKDILDCQDRIVYVRWHDECAQWDSEFIRYQGKLCSNGITPIEWKYRSVVIGNIHDGKGGQHE